jgi:hypothetical protein
MSFLGCRLGCTFDLNHAGAEPYQANFKNPGKGGPGLACPFISGDSRHPSPTGTGTDYTKTVGLPVIQNRSKS